MRKRTPSARSFVACTKGAQRIRRLGREHDAIVEVENIDPARNLMLVRLRGGPRSPRKSWERAREIVGPRTPLQPVLSDEAGAELLPTGTFHVRFNQVPKGAEIRRFERKHEVKLILRNKFQPAQCEFAPVNRAQTYLPDVVREIESAGEVRAVWQDVLAQFHRSE
jgi:hypothetical protein